MAGLSAPEQKGTMGRFKALLEGEGLRRLRLLGEFDRREVQDGEGLGFVRIFCFILLVHSWHIVNGDAVGLRAFEPMFDIPLCK